MSQAEWDAIEEEIAVYHIGTRTESAALLAWFLHTVWRLDLPDVDDAICDGPGDKGIDALVADENQREITLFQSKHRTSADADQGDKDLRNLIGAAAYFESAERVDALDASKPNPELRRLLKRLRVAERVADGSHVTRAVFLTNGVLDPSGRDYLRSMSGRHPALDVWDGPRLAELAQRTKRPDLRPERVTLASTAPPTAVDLGAGVKMAVALVPATELLALPGIADRTLFARNVRLGVGSTRVNRELTATLDDRDEHALFPAYHNGMTLLTRRIDVVGSELRLDGVSVVNGCQSLLALDAHRGEVGDDLRLLVKAVQVDPQSDLADTITYRTNNQNAVDIRDQRSTDLIQRDLQAQVRDAYGRLLGYAIRAGERPGGMEVMDNASAAQLLMAVYVGEPWNAVRKVRLFDQDYHRIFNRSINAHRLFLVHELGKLIGDAKARLRPDLQASFASVRLTLTYLVATVLRESGPGAELLERPERWLPEKLDDVRSAIGGLVDDVVESLNFYVEDRSREDEDFDPKVVFKSQSGVRALESEVVKSARRQAKRDSNFLFSVTPER
jgi:hypothetical protein